MLPQRRRSIGEPSSTADNEIKRKASTFFGINSLKPEQLTAIRACLYEKDTVVTLPTGFGKSLCFQLIPTLTGGTVIVICPLLALAADQVFLYAYSLYPPFIALRSIVKISGLRARGFKAEMFQGRRRQGMQNDNWKIRKLFVRGELQFCTSALFLVSLAPVHFSHLSLLIYIVFMTPEFALSSFRRCFASLPLNQRPHIPTVAVDECHLIEEWCANAVRAPHILSLTNHSCMPRS